MAIQPIELMGGESVYCFNQSQLKAAQNLAYEDPETSPRIQSEISRLETEMPRNERAALAFIIIDRLLKSADEDNPSGTPSA